MIKNNFIARLEIILIFLWISVALKDGFSDPTPTPSWISRFLFSERLKTTKTEQIW